MVVPDGHDENDTLGEALSNALEATERLVLVVVTEGGLALIAERIGDRVTGADAVDVDLGVLDDFAVLLVDTADLDELTGVGVALGDELGDNSELGAGVDKLAGAVEGGVAKTVRVEVAAVFVADTIVTFVAITTISTLAADLAVDGARMGSVCGGDGVGLPDIHLLAAGTVPAGAGVGVGRGLVPVEQVGLGITNQLPITGKGWNRKSQHTSPLMNLIS